MSNKSNEEMSYLSSWVEDFHKQVMHSYTIKEDLCSRPGVLKVWSLTSINSAPGNSLEMQILGPP